MDVNVFLKEPEPQSTYMLKAHPLDSMNYIILNAMFILQLLTDGLQSDHMLYDNLKRSGILHVSQITKEIKYRMLKFWMDTPTHALLDAIYDHIGFICVQYLTHRLYGRYSQIQLFENCDNFVDPISPVLLQKEQLLLVFLNNRCFHKVFSQNIYYLFNMNNLTVESSLDLDQNRETDSIRKSINILEKSIVHKATLNKKFISQNIHRTVSNKSTAPTGFFAGKPDETYAFRTTNIELVPKEQQQQLVINSPFSKCTMPTNCKIIDYSAGILEVFASDHKNISVLLTLLFYLDHTLQSIYDLIPTSNKLQLLTVCALYNKLKLVPNENNVGGANKTKLIITSRLNNTLEQLVLNAQIL